MENNNNNNGRGIFYGVIGVATLVVAIIGATFAYFSAEVTRNNIVNIGSTTLNLDLINEQSNFRMDMVPVETISNDGSNTPNTNFYTFPGLNSASDAKGAGTCRDLVGNSICSVYQFTIKNPSTTVAQTVVGSMKIATNSGFENLYYALFKGTATQVTSYKVHDTAVVTAPNAGTPTQTDSDPGSVIVKATKITDAGDVYDEDNSDWGNTLELLNPGEETTYTMVIWLEDTGIKQDEQGKTFSAGITFTSDTGAGVTGILTTGAQ